MTILHPTTSTSHTRAVRAAWIAIAASPFVLGAAVVVALLLGGGGTGGLWIGGTLLALAAMAAPTVALVESRAADRRAEHGAGPALAASAAASVAKVVTRRAPARPRPTATSTSSSGCA